MKKDLLGLKDISAKEIENILETAGTYETKIINKNN